MRTLLTISALLLSLFSTAALAEAIHVGVDGLVCAFCAKGIEKGLKKNAAVDAVTVDMDKKLVTITIKDKQTLEDTAITQIITEAGYKVTGIHHAK